MTNQTKSDNPYDDTVLLFNGEKVISVSEMITILQSAIDKFGDIPVYRFYGNNQYGKNNSRFKIRFVPNEYGQRFSNDPKPHDRLMIV